MREKPDKDVTARLTSVPETLQHKSTSTHAQWFLTHAQRRDGKCECVLTSFSAAVSLCVSLCVSVCSSCVSVGLPQLRTGGADPPSSGAAACCELTALPSRLQLGTRRTFLPRRAALSPADTSHKTRLWHPPNTRASDQVINLRKLQTHTDRKTHKKIDFLLSGNPPKNKKELWAVTWNVITEPAVFSPRCSLLLLLLIRWDTEF